MTRIISSTLPVCQLNEEQKQVMFKIFEKYYSDTSFELFCNDLSEKTHLFMFRNNQNDLVGFSTILKRKINTSQSTATLLYSGDTVIEKKYWGKKFLQKSFFWYILNAKLRSPFRPVYWMLISKGFKTYLLMRKNFPYSFPNSQKATPIDLKQIMNDFYSEKFGNHYKPQVDRIEFSTSSSSVRNGMACPKGEALKDIDVKFFLEKNPDYEAGQELTCIAEIRFRDFLFHIGKFFNPLKRASLLFKLRKLKDPVPT